MHGAPPQVVWLCVGNGPTSEVAGLLRESEDRLRRFCGRAETPFLVLPPYAGL